MPNSSPQAEAVGGRYRLVNRVASGGMGDVWRATDELLGRQVAVKVLKPEFGDDASFRLRFRAEARASASLSHPGVATVFDYGEESVAGGIHTAYLVMELVPGEALNTLLARTVTLDPAHAMDVVAQTASALQAAHDHGIVHRDVKPANLLVRPDGRIKITDFGIARAADAMALTQTGTLLGTVAYMSPEQLNGQTATPASDLYSLGVVAYLCLAGRTPFAGGETMAVALAHVRESVPPLPDDVPPSVQVLVHQLLEKDPARRPASARMLAAAAAGIRNQLIDGRAPALSGKQPAIDVLSTVPAAGPVGRLPTVPFTAGPETVVEETTAPLGSTLGGAGATVARPDDVRPHMRQSRRRRRWGTMGVLVGIAVLAVALGLWASSGPSVVTVPAVQHLAAPAAESIITKAGLYVSTHAVDAGTPSDRVVTQTPPARERVKAGSTVTLAVSSGFVDLPSSALIGKPYSQVAASVVRLGLRPSRQETVSSSPTDTVLAVNPAGRVKLGATIALSVAVAPVPTTVPTTVPTAPTTPGRHGGGEHHGDSKPN